MKLFRTLSSEIIGLIFLLISAAATMSFPGIADFWLALATAITLFFIMYVRLLFGAPGAGGETSSR
jgi:hypothetical protein